MHGQKLRSYRQRRLYNRSRSSTRRHFAVAFSKTAVFKKECRKKGSHFCSFALNAAQLQTLFKTQSPRHRVVRKRSTVDMEKEAVQKLLRVTPLTDDDGGGGGSILKRGYRCQRCRNHNFDVARKGHVDQCPYRACRCSQCVLVERRTDTHRLLKQKAILKNVLERKFSSGSTDSEDKEPLVLVTPFASTAQRSMDRKRELSKSEKRTLRCAKCSNHDVQAPLKNHKQTCPYRSCCCSMCHLVDDYRNILKDQIKTRRMQSRLRATTHFVTSDQSIKSQSQNRKAPERSTSPTPAVKPKACPPNRKSVIVSSASPRISDTEPVASTPEMEMPLDASMLGEKANHVLLLGHLAALSTIWQQQGRAFGLPLPLMPTYDLYNAFSSHGMNFG